MSEALLSPEEVETLISNLAEAEAYQTGFVHGVFVALQYARPSMLAEIRKIMARARELEDA